MSSYKLIWKGETIGSFSVDDIREMLKSGKIGLMYQIELPSGEIVFLKDFFDENSLEMNVNMGINADSSCENKKSISHGNGKITTIFTHLTTRASVTPRLSTDTT